MKDGRMRGGTVSRWLYVTVGAEERVPEVLRMPELVRLVEALQRTRWTGRPGFPLGAMVGVSVFKAMYSLPNWRDTVALIGMRPELQRVLGCSEVPSEWACYRYARKLRQVADEVDLASAARRRVGLARLARAPREREAAVARFRLMRRAGERLPWQVSTPKHSRLLTAEQARERDELLAAQARDLDRDARGWPTGRGTISLDALLAEDFCLGDVLSDLADFTAMSDVERMMKTNGTADLRPGRLLLRTGRDGEERAA